jgi:hypothetical protein
MIPKKKRNKKKKKKERFHFSLVRCRLGAETPTAGGLGEERHGAHV